MMQKRLSPAGTARQGPAASRVFARPGRLAPVRAYVEEKQRGAPGAPAAANQLEALKAMSVVVADTGEPELVKKYKPQVSGAPRGWTLQHPRAVVTGGNRLNLRARALLKHLHSTASREIKGVTCKQQVTAFVWSAASR